MRSARIVVCFVLLFALASCRVVTPTPGPAPLPAESTSEAPPLPPIQSSPVGETTPDQTVLPTVDALPAPKVLPPATVTSDPALPPTQAPAQVAVLAPAVPMLPYSIQTNSPVYLPNFARPQLGCAWMGVAGQVFDLSGNPRKFIVVTVGGLLSGSPVNNLGMTGNATAYGPGGYEVDLSTQVRASSGTLWLQLTDLQGNVLSPRYFINTYADCQRNLVLVNFNELGPYRLFLPRSYR